MRHHPEQTSDEIFVGNHDVDNWPDPKLSTLKTARLGNVAYDIDGKKLPATYGLRPLLIGKSEEDKYDQIMMAGMREAAR